jgi:ABC-type transport system involved in cytochrome bd biosynthesis fused ATPase/permease subunit
MYILSGLVLIGISGWLISVKFKSAYAGLGETKKPMTWEFLE